MEDKMYDNYWYYLLFFIVSSIVFSIMGVILRWYMGNDWLKFITRIAVVIIFIGFFIWCFTLQNETADQLDNNIMLMFNILLFVFIPLITGELISVKINEKF